MNQRAEVVAPGEVGDPITVVGFAKQLALRLARRPRQVSLGIVETGRNGQFGGTARGLAKAESNGVLRACEPAGPSALRGSGWKIVPILASIATQ